MKMDNQHIQTAELVSSECLSHYASLGGKGKPQTGRQWTNMAAIVMTTTGAKFLNILCLDYFYILWGQG